MLDPHSWDTADHRAAIHAAFDRFQQAFYRPQGRQKALNVEFRVLADLTLQAEMRRQRWELEDGKLPLVDVA